MVTEDTHQQQRQFWHELVQLKVHVAYLHEYHLESEKRERHLNYLLADDA